MTPTYWTRKADAQKYADKLVKAWSLRDVTFTLERATELYHQKWAVVARSGDNEMRVRKHKRLALYGLPELPWKA